MSWKPEVQTDSSGQWYGNGLRFATKDEAKKSVADLKRRWTLVHATRSTASDDPVTDTWVSGRLKPVG